MSCYCFTLLYLLILCFWKAYCQILESVFHIVWLFFHSFYVSVFLTENSSAVVVCSSAISYSDSAYLLLFFVCLLLCVVCRILVPQPGIKLSPLQWKHQILTAGPPGSSFIHCNLNVNDHFCHFLEN